MRRSTISSTANGELALVERIRRRAASYQADQISFGIGDDCALIKFKPGEEAAVTTDLSIQDRHFRLDLHPPESVGHRTLARGLSDIASMGARPVAAFLSLGLPPELTRPRRRQPVWIDRYFDGFLALACKHKTSLAGGDLAQSPLALADIVLIGGAPKGEAMMRSGARPGDLLYVTGSLGGSAYGLRQLTKIGSRHRSAGQGLQLAHHLYPEPRIAQGLWLRKKRAATAAIDISDGLSTDLEHLCIESEVSAELDLAALPVFENATVDDALHGGEDYELLFTARPTTRIPLAIAGIPITPIGRMTKHRKGQPRLILIDAKGRHALQPRGWEHFKVRGERV